MGSSKDGNCVFTILTVSIFTTAGPTLSAISAMLLLKASRAKKESVCSVSAFTLPTQFKERNRTKAAVKMKFLFIFTVFIFITLYLHLTIKIICREEK